MWLGFGRRSALIKSNAVPRAGTSSAAESIREVARQLQGGGKTGLTLTRTDLL
jgi:hypothetical protein